MRGRILSRGQSELIAGVIILSVIFTAVVPLMLRIQVSTISRQNAVLDKAKFLQLRAEEALSLGGVPQTQENVRKGIFPGIWINNTGTVPVTLHTLVLIDKDTGKPQYLIDMSEIGKPWEIGSLIEWAVINPGTSREDLVKGEYPVLRPGDSLLIKLSLTAEEAGKYYFSVVTARGNVLPHSGVLAYVVPPATLGGGGGEWKGLFYPVSGFRMIGAEDILSHSSVVGERPLGRADDGVVNNVEYSYIYDDYDHPGYYRVGYILRTGEHVEYRGFIGTFYMGEDSQRGGLYVYIDGYYIQKLVYDSDGHLIENETAPVKIYQYPGKFATVEDYDENNVKELALDTISGDADEDGNADDDVMLMRILVDKDITHADYIHISAKVVYDYYVHVVQPTEQNYRADLRIFYVAIYRYTSKGWRFVHYKDMPFSAHGPRSFAFEATFPLNRSDIYRMAIILLDPYRSTVRDYYEFYVGLEYLYAEWGINNPYLQNLPTIYLLALDNYTAGGIGGGNETEDLHKLTKLVEDELMSVGASNYLVINNEELLNNLLLKNPPKNAIIINLHGTQSPIDPSIVKDNIYNNGWIWVNIVGDPPVKPDNVILDSSSNVSATTGADWDGMVRKFSLYNLKESVWSNYSAIETGANPPSFVFYENASEKRAVSAAWKYGEGYIIVNSLPPLDWEGEDPHGTNPTFDATLAAFTSLYIWYLTKSS